MGRMNERAQGRRERQWAGRNRGKIQGKKRLEEETRRKGDTSFFQEQYVEERLVVRK